MRRVMYIGSKPSKPDNIAGTGLNWTPGQIHEMTDDAKALKLLQHSAVWVDADKWDGQLPTGPAANDLLGLPRDQTVMVVVPRDMFDKVKAGLAQVTIVELPKPEAAGLQKREDVQLVEEAKPTVSEFAGKKRSEIAEILRTKYKTDVDARKFAESPEGIAQMIEFAEAVASTHQA